jgi:hypothetical protein
MKRELLFAGILFCAVGCTSGGGVEVRKVAFVLPQSWVKAESDDKEVSLGVPPGWRHGANNLFGTSNPFAGGAPNDPTAPSMTADEKKTMDQISGTMSEIVKEDELKNLDKLKEKGIILHVVSTGKPVIGEELTRFYVKKKTQNGNWTWPETDASEQDCFLTKQKATEVKLPIGLAHKMQATWQLSDGSNYTQISYLVPSGRDLFVLRFITVESAEVITNIEKEVAQTLRVN